MKNSKIYLGRFAAGCLLISSLGMLAGCRSSQVKMPCWPWANSGDVVEPTPAQPSYQSSPLPAPTGELLPVPPEPTFGTQESDPARIPPAPAPMPDELAPAPILPAPLNNEVPSLEEEAQDDSEEYLNIPSETSLNLPEKKPGSLFSRKVLAGHVPLKDRSHAAVELDSSSTALSGEEPKVESGRRIHRTLFR